MMRVSSIYCILQHGNTEINSNGRKLIFQSIGILWKIAKQIIFDGADIMGFNAYIVISKVTLFVCLLSYFVNKRYLDGRQFLAKFLNRNPSQILIYILITFRNHRLVYIFLISSFLNILFIVIYSSPQVISPFSAPSKPLPANVGCQGTFQLRTGYWFGPLKARDTYIGYQPSKFISFFHNS